VAVLLCSSCADSKVIFQREAAVYTSAGMMHVAMPLDLSYLHRFCDSAKDQWSRIKQMKKSDFEPEVQDYLLSLYYETRESCVELDGWRVMGGTRTDEASGHGRQKRFITALLAGTVFGAVVEPIVESWFHSDALEQDQMQTRKQVAQLTRKYNDLLSAITLKRREMAAAVTLSHQTATFTSTAGRYTRAFAMLATTYRLSPPLLPMSAVPKIWEQVEKATGKKMPYPPEAAYELPASFRLEDGVLHVVLHVPLLDAAFWFYRLHPFPLGPEREPFYLVPETEKLLAVNLRGTTYFEMGLADVTDCLKLGHLHVCAVRVVRHDFQDTCLAALYGGHNEAARRRCQQVPVTEAWALGATAEGSGGYHLWLKEALPYTTTCSNNGSIIPGKFRAGYSTFVASASCTIASRVFSVLEDANQTTTTAVVRAFEYGALERASRSFVTQKWNVTEAPEFAATTSFSMSGSHIAVIVLGAIVAGLVVTLFAVLRCVYRKSKEESTLATQVVQEAQPEVQENKSQ